MNRNNTLQFEPSSSERHLEGFITKTTLAKRYGVSTRCIDNWMHRGLIPFTKICGIVRFNVTKVDAALAQFEVGGR